MARLPDLIAFAQAHGLKIGTIADLIKHRSANESLVTKVSERMVQTAYGPFKLLAYRDRAAGQPHLALVRGHPSPERETLVRVHEPFTALDAIESESLLHSWSLAQALAAVDRHQEGVVVLLNCAPPAELLFAKLSQSGAASAGSGASSQLRNYGIGAAILRDVGVGRMLVLSPPRKMPSMMGFGLEVTGYKGGDEHE